MIDGSKAHKRGAGSMVTVEEAIQYRYIQPGQNRHKNIDQITKIPTELNFCGDHGYAIRNKMSKVPIDPMCAKKVIQGQRSKFWFFNFSRKR